YESIKLKYPPILNPLLKALGADLYALTMSVDAKDQANGTNDEEYTYFLGMNQVLERHLREKDASKKEKDISRPATSSCARGRSTVGSSMIHPYPRSVARPCEHN
ncbi:hypothetical protein Tco_1488022, partial [Tanacetum coccineum]